MTPDFLKIILGDKKRNMLNVGLDCFLNISRDKQAGKIRFIKRYNVIPESKVDEYFHLYKEVYVEAEKILSNLYKLCGDDVNGKNKRSIELEFRSTISKKYTWLDKKSLNRLYDTACYYLR